MRRHQKTLWASIFGEELGDKIKVVFSPVSTRGSGATADCVKCIKYSTSGTPLFAWRRCPYMSTYVQSRSISQSLDEIWSTCFIKLVNFYWEWLQTPPVITWWPWLLKLDHSNEVQGPEIPAESEDGVSTRPEIPATSFIKRDTSLLR